MARLEDDKERCHGMVAPRAARAARRDDAERFFEERARAEIERTIHAAPNAEREGMNWPSSRSAAGVPACARPRSAAAKRIGKVEVDHGDTACKTPDAAEYIEKSWAHATSKGFESPAAQERSRETPRRRC